MKKTNHPEWATKYREKGKELRFIRGTYYLYEYSNIYNKKKKKTKKISGKLLGKITEKDGFIESNIRKKEKGVEINSVQVKEYGIYSFIENHLSEYKTLLEKHFPEHWKIILALVYGRFTHNSAMKNIDHFYNQSYLSEEYPKLNLSKNNLTSLYREIGSDREKITNFFKEFSNTKDNILFDGTDLFSKSEKMDLPKLSKTKKGNFAQIINTMFVFSIESQLPIYYRLVSGNIVDIKSFKLCLEESGIKDATVVADKGFYSESNIEKLEKENLNFIIPLHRNNKLIDYKIIESGDKKEFEGYFEYEKRIIWFYEIKPKDKIIKNQRILVYLNDELKSEEINNYVHRTNTHPEKYQLEKFYKKQYSFGTITISSNSEKTAKELYVDYKSRGQIENMIDNLKNTLDADNSYMQNEQALETWMFINFIALHWYYKIYQLLVKHDLNSKYSIKDLIIFLKGIKKVKINDNWHNAEITKKTEDILSKLEIVT